MLTAREHGARLVRPVAEDREEAKHVVHRPAARPPRVLHAEQEVLAHGQRREDVPVLRYVAEPLARDRVGREPADLLDRKSVV